MTDIYEFITSHGVLTDAHRQDLKTKRGFTDETIKRARYFSGGQYLLSLEKELAEKFKIEDLIAAGVFLKKASTYHLDPILLDDRIIIPYLSKDGLATLLRPHKLGLKGVPVQIYQPFNLVWEETPRETFCPLWEFIKNEKMPRLPDGGSEEKEQVLQSLSRRAYETLEKDPSFKPQTETKDELSKLFKSIIETGGVNETAVRSLWSLCSDASSGLQQPSEGAVAMQGSSRVTSPDPTTLIITEGEFKAAAGRQLGANCVALPGVGSYSGKNYEDLLSFLNTYKIKKICIIFDNEIKDNPKLPNYKPDVNDRYDTQYYAFIMGKMLNKSGFETMVGTLPDAWRMDGKIDIDGALSQGKTQADLDSVCRRAVTPKEFYDNLDKEAQEIVKKKEAKRYFKSHIKVDFGRYIATRYNGKREWDEPISNFTLKIVATHERVDGIVRELRFVNEFGKSAPFFAISPEEMAGNDSFKAFCLRHGNFIWKGRNEDLSTIWEYEFLNDPGRHIIEPDCIGWLPEDKMWVFGNVAFGPEGELRPDDHGIFWTEKCGYKPVALGVSSGKNVIAEGIPYLTLNQCNIAELRLKLEESIGEYEAMICLGWVFSVMFMEEVFRHYGCFPFLFITGRRRSGKSTVAEWMMNLCGLENSGKQAGDTTSVAMQRYMSYYSSLPFFVDEYRNDLKVTQKNGLFRNAYNRQSAGKGMKSEFGTREAKVRGTIILAGEETPADNALLTRCIVVQVSEIRRKINNFDWFTKNRSKLSTFAYHILSNRKAYLDKFMPRLLEDKEEIAGLVNDDRLAINMAVVSAGVWALFGEDKAFAKAFIKDIKIAKQEQEAENVVSSFFADVKAMAVQPQHRLKELWELRDGKAYFYFHAIYNVWASDYQSRHREAPFKSDAIRNYLKDEPGFVDMSVMYRMKSGNNRCVVFSYDAAPDFIKDLFEPENVAAPTATVAPEKEQLQHRKDLK